MKVDRSFKPHVDLVTGERAMPSKQYLTTMKSGISLYDPNFLPRADADRLFAALEKLPWKRHTMKRHGKEIPMPRRTK